MYILKEIIHVLFADLVDNKKLIVKNLLRLNDTSVTYTLKLNLPENTQAKNGKFPQMIYCVDGKNKKAVVLCRVSL